MKKSKQVFQLMIVLEEIRPSIWRRVVVDANTLLPDLHKIVQVVMGWTNSHLHHFVINGQFYHDPDEEAMTEYINYSRVRLNQVVDREGMKFFYEYDFGDCWVHAIEVETILPRKKGQYYPICFDGERSCPPEDCGGAPGYEHLLEVLNDPNHEEYAKLNEWVGDYFKPEEFDIALVNKLLQQKDYGAINYFD
jgi:hypothetical protein